MKRDERCLNKRNIYIEDKHRAQDLNLSVGTVSRPSILNAHQML